MRILKLFQHKSKWFYLVLALMGLGNAMSNIVLFVVINKVITKQHIQYLEEGHTFWVYLLGITSSFVINNLFQSYMIKLTANLTHSVEMSIFEKLQLLSYDEFLNLGKERFYSLLNDARIVSGFPSEFINSFNALVMTIIASGYMFAVTPVGGMVVMLILYLLAYVYYKRNIKISYYYHEARLLSDAYYRIVNDFLLGFRELKMNEVKNYNLYHKFLSRSKNRAKVLHIKASTAGLSNELIGTYSWYVIIGLALFVLPNILNLDKESVATFLIVILFLMGPVASLVTAYSNYSQIQLAVDKIMDFYQRPETSSVTEVRGNYTNTCEAFQHIRFENIIFQYKNGQFTLQIDCLEIILGEILFIVGGNGSGKSTFLNIMIGLIAPDSGNVYLNGNNLSIQEYQKNRALFSVIFSDQYLFSENYDNYIIDSSDEDLKEYIELMNLTNIITINDELNKLDVELSRGQQKRLAMIYALMEKRDILVLDEWAAEQDPIFRCYFYKEVLPGLKRKRKTIIVVSHDDAYYSYADRIVKFDNGRIVLNQSN